MDLVSIVSVDAPELVGDIVTIGGLNELPGPPGEKVAVIVTIPEKPFRLTRLIVDWLEPPAMTVRET